MNATRNLCLILVISFFTAIGISQETKVLETDVQITYAVKQGTTLPIRDVNPRSILNKDKMQANKAKYKIPKNFVGRFPSREKKDLKQLKGQESVRQKTHLKNGSGPIIPSVNIEGLSVGSPPHDPSGDVGKDHYVQAINITTIGVYRKDGTLVTTFNGSTIWGQLGFASGGDPIIMYDQEFDRWIITEFPSGFGPPSNQLLFAISENSDPLGSYDVYNFPTPEFPDYPKYSIWSNAYSVTTNEDGPGVFHAYFINREEMLAGEDVVQIQRVSLPGQTGTEQNFVVATPVDWTGETPPADDNPLVVSLNDASWNPGQMQDEVIVSRLNLDWENENNTAFEQIAIPVAPYDSNPCSFTQGFQCIPQLNGIGLDGLPEIIMNNPQYRNFGTHESLVLNFITDATDGQNFAGIRWMELRKESGTEWDLYQEGTYAPDDGLHRWMAGIAMDGDGNIGMAYSVSNESTFVGLRFTARRNGDPLGIMTAEEIKVIDGQSAVEDFFGQGRYSDYSHMSIDPIDDKTFWFTSEYGSETETTTRILAFSLPDTFDIGPSTLFSPISGDLSSNEEVSVEIRNFGIQAIDNFSVGYIIENEDAYVNQGLNVTVSCDEPYTHTFDKFIDMSEVGLYTLKIFTSAEVDENIFNDTMSYVIEHLPDVDVSMNLLDDGLNNILCSSDYSVTYEITNTGLEEINTATIEVFLNGTLIETIDYVGLLESGMSESFQYDFAALESGDNEIRINISSPNAVDDYYPLNNESIRNIRAEPDFEQVSLEILTDTYPDETTWTVTDLESMSTVASGGPYETAETLYIEDLCLDPEKCYRFEISDVYGDGLAAGFGVRGSYEIYDASGDLLASIMEINFGFSETNEFCSVFVCDIQADILITSESSPGEADGFAIVDVFNGLGPFSYSLDGVSFQEGASFDNLAAGNYTITILGENNCMIEIPFAIDGVSSTQESDNKITLGMSPNPTLDNFQINVEGINSNDVFIPVSIYDTKGKIIQRGQLGKFNNTYMTTMSLRPHPSGMYFVKIHHEDIPRLSKIIRG